jgi:acyl-CoA synthetase (NDP forming)
MLDVRDEPSLRASYSALASRLGDTMTGTLVQKMVPAGVELIVGGVADATFGPLVACGSGGVLVDLLGDMVFRLHPLTELEAADMVGSLKSLPLLRGYRGQPPADEKAVIETLLRISALMAIAPEVQELDINPLKVLPHGVVALDVRIRVSRREPTVPTRRVSY